MQSEATENTFTYMLVDKARHGRFLVNPNDVCIGRSMITYGEWSDAEVRLFAKILRPSDVVVEAGANIGTHTVPLSKLVGKAGRVVALEPQRLIFQMLCANLALNDCWNVDCRNVAVGNTLGEVTMDNIMPEFVANFGSLRVNDCYSNSLGADVVSMVTIDSLGLSQVDLIKADVEGFERAVVSGARETIKKYRPVIYVEHNDLADWSVPELFEELQYDCYWYFTTLWDARNYNGVLDDIWSVSGLRICSFDMLALPQGGRWRLSGLQKVDKNNPVTKANAPLDSENYFDLPVVWRD